MQKRVYVFYDSCRWKIKVGKGEETRRVKDREKRAEKLGRREEREKKIKKMVNSHVHELVWNC